MKDKRQNKIKEIIEMKNIETQDELLAELTNAGFTTTQATISRDIREMNLTKVADGNGKQKYTMLQNAKTDVSAKYHQVLNAGILNMDYAENTIVIHTVSGMAMAVAAALDNMNLQGFMGCIAGDDTIFCVARSSAFCKEIIADIKKIASDDMLEV
ncbi:MAG: arginine repressor [Lachnospiraceae bacterium]|nr:arginine repressor [Lachnospiraceae bacterium]